MIHFTSRNRWDRSIKKRPNKRSKCYCGCNGRSTHFGLGQGAVMMSGCELSVRRWLRDGPSARKVGE